MNFKWITLIVLLVIISGVMFTKIVDKDLGIKEATVLKKENSLDTLSISPQSPTDKVIANSATLSKKGFLVLREMAHMKILQYLLVMPISRTKNSL